jgi:hypothetical protein
MREICTSGLEGGGAGQPALPTPIGAGVEHSGDVDVIHQGQGLTLGLEAGNDLLRVHASLDKLDGHQALDRLRLLGHPHRTHAAFADLLDQLVRTDDETRSFKRCCLFGRVLKSARRRFDCGVLQEAACAFVEPQQVLHVLAQIRLRAAGLGQVGMALGWVCFLQCGDEDVTLGHDRSLYGLLSYSAESAHESRKLFLTNLCDLGLGVLPAQRTQQPGARVGPEEIGAAG